MGHWNRKSVAAAAEEAHFRQHPSFSSTLLDSIYRSIEKEGERQSVGRDSREPFAPATHSNTMKKKQSSRSYDVIKVTNYVREEETMKVRRTSMAERLMEEKPTEMFAHRRRSLPDFDRKVVSDHHHHHHRPSSMFVHSTSSSSDSSSVGGFSSSEPESVNHGSRSRSSSVPTQRPKPVRTSVSARPENDRRNPSYSNSISEKKSSKHHESGFIKTKSRALKIYGDLKKVKQPISPGGKLASFINSLFTAKSKAGKRSSVDHEEDLMSKSKASTTPSASSTTSSSSRSCLSSKTHSSNGKLSNGVKRSVRFYPVSVIVDEDSRPCGHKSLHYRDEQQRRQPMRTLTTPSSAVMMEEDELIMKKKIQMQRIEEATRDLIKSYRKKEISSDLMIMNNTRDVVGDLEEDLDEDDDGSCASSDLFELENLGAIGVGMVDDDDELPVYETTHLPTNRAIANGFIL